MKKVFNTCRFFVNVSVAAGVAVMIVSGMGLLVAADYLYRKRKAFDA